MTVYFSLGIMLLLFFSNFLLQCSTAYLKKERERYRSRDIYVYVVVCVTEKEKGRQGGRKEGRREGAISRFCHNINVLPNLFIIENVLLN